MPVRSLGITSNTHGFLYSGGTYTTLDDPSAIPGGGGTTASGINAAGQIVGYYNGISGAHGFLYNNGIYATIDDPLADSSHSFRGTFAMGINAANQIVGYYVDSLGHNHGFLESGGSYTTLDDPLAGSSGGSQGTFATGINDIGQVVGYYYDASFAVHAFLYSGGTYTTVDDPLGNEGTQAYGINNNGQIVGQYAANGGYHGFVENTAPNPPPPGGTTADMILRGANTSPAVAGQYEIYDIGNNAILAGYSLGQVGTDWQFVGLGGFNGSGLLRLDEFAQRS